MIGNLCLSCGDDLDWPSGDGCANMTAHKNDNKPWEMRVTDMVDNDDGGTTISFDLDKEAHQAMANIGVQFVLHCVALCCCSGRYAGSLGCYLEDGREP